MRLDKLVANAGAFSRADVKKLIKQGRITIDHVVANKAETHVDPDENVICVDNEAVNYREFAYIMLNKPNGYISATEDKRHKTVTELLPEQYRKLNLFPVGRLDIDTEGLLLMTNDGQLTHDLLSPKKHVDKTYFVRSNHAINAWIVEKFEKGVTLDDEYKTLPAKCEILGNEDEPEYGLTCHLTIQEGKYHQVKRMFESIGTSVAYLKRIRMGSLKLDPKLALGAFRELTKDEIINLKERK